MGLEEIKSSMRSASAPAQSTGGGLDAIKSQLRGNVEATSQPRQQSYQDPGGLVPATNIEEFGNNAAADIGDSLQGLSALGSYAAMRAAQSWLPRGTFEPDLVKTDPLSALMPYGPSRQTDAQMIGDMAKGVYEHYDKNVVGPFARAAGAASGGDWQTAGQELSVPLDYARTRPVSALMDFMPLGEAAVGQAAKIAKPMMPAVAKTVKTALPGVAEWNDIRSAVKQNRELRQSEDWRYQNKLKDQFTQMQEAYDKIPANIKPHLTEGGEVRNATSEALVRGNAEASAYLDLKDKFNKANGQLYKNTGAMTGLEEQMAQWGPAIVKRAREKGMDWFDYPDLMDPANQPLVQAMRKQLEAAGHKPVYSGIVKKTEVAPTAKRASSLFEGTPQATEQLAKDVALNQPAAKQTVSDSSKLPSAFRTRSVGERIPDYHETDDLKAWQTRTIQGLQFVHYLDYMKKLASLSDDLLTKYPKLAQKGSVVNLQEFMNNLARSSHMDPEAAAKFINSVGPNLVLPTPLAKEVVKMTKAAPSWGVFGKMNMLFKTFTLGLDMFWAVNQSMQSGMAANVAMWRSPRDVATSLIAYKMAFDLKKKLPASFFADIGIIEGGVESTEFLANYGKMGTAIQGYMNTVFGVTTAAENYWRGVLGAYNLMREVEKVDKSARVPLHKAMDIMTRQQQVFTALNNQKAVEAASKEVLKWMGDYSPMAAKQAGIWRQVMPFFLWYQHAASLTKAMVVDTPVKTALINRLNQLAPGLLQDPTILTENEMKRGAIVLTDPNNNPLLDPNGNYQTTTNAGFTPFSQTPQLLLGAANFVTNNGDPVEGLMFSPLFQYVFQIAGVNVQSGRPFSNPHAYSMAGQKFRNEDGEAEKIERQGLPFENALLQPVFPRIAQAMKSINAGEFRPTDQTSVLPWGDAAIQRTREFPDGVKAMEPWQKFIFGFTKLNVSPQIYDRESQENMDRREAKKFGRTVRQQDWRTGRDASALERLRGYVSNEGVE